MPNDVDLSSALKVKADAVFISHAHMDHVGNVGLLDANIPIVASPMSTVILKSMMDCGSAAMESEVAYAASRKASEEDARILKTEDYRKSPYIGQRIFNRR